MPLIFRTGPQLRLRENWKGRLWRGNRRFSQEFKDEAVRMVLNGPRPVAHVAKELGIHDTTLGNWVNTYRRTRGDGPTSAREPGEHKSERELALERENRKLREENEFLKKAAAFFAREQR